MRKEFSIRCLVCIFISLALCVRHRRGLWMSAGLIQVTNTFIHYGSSGDDNLFIQTNTDHALCQRLARARKILQLSVDRCFRSLAYVAPQSKQKAKNRRWRSLCLYIYRAAYSLLVALAHLPHHRNQFLLIRNVFDAQCTSAIVIQSSLLRIRAFRFLFRVCFFSLLFLRCVQCLHFLLRVYDRPGDCV